MAEEKGKRIENFLEREEKEKQRLRREKREASIEAQRAKNARVSAKAKKSDILSGLIQENVRENAETRIGIGKGSYMPASERDIRIKLSDARKKTDDLIEVYETAKERLSVAEKHYKGADKEEAFKKMRAEVARLQRDVKNAQKEELWIEQFEENANEITKIYSLQQREVTKRQNNLSKARNDLEKANAGLEEIKTKIEQNEKDFKEIRAERDNVNKELLELVRKTEKFGQGEDEITPEQSAEQLEDLRKVSELSNKKTALEEELKKQQKDKGTIELFAEKKKIEETAKVAKSKISLYEKGESEEDRVINRCQEQIDLLLEGKSWKDISRISLEKVYGKQKEELGHPELTPEPTAEPKQIDEENQEPAQEQAPERKEPDETESQSLIPNTNRFKFKHPILAKIPFVARIANRFMDRKRAKRMSEEYDYDEELQEENTELSEGNASNAVEEKTEPIQTARLPEETKKEAQESMKDRRDLFAEYLREAVSEGHTEQFKYSTREGLKDKEMRDRIDVRTQKEEENRNQIEDENER